jgi:hypothetical protein
MSLIAESELAIAGPLQSVFSRFIDYPRWAAWMPPGFRPVRGPARSLREGDRLVVRVSGLLTLLRVERVKDADEVCWSGGVPGLLRARHSFLFESVGEGSTRIRSVEPWTGLLTHVPPVSRSIARKASEMGLAQLQGFERWFVEERAAGGGKKA